MSQQAESLFTFFESIDGLIADFPTDSIVSRTIVNNDKFTATIFGFDAGQELTEHTSTKAAIIHILKGEATLTLGDARYEVKAGAWASMTPNLKHSLLAHTQAVMLLLMMK
ncbi:MAG: cupin domain-containing protein [Anaerolineae bacterium]|nr:cupin domain-containing protein [Anaerolineae bacterium]